MIDFIVDYFDIIALALTSLGLFCFKDKRNSLAVLFCFVVSYFVSAVDLTYMNKYYYLVMCLFTLLYVSFSFSVKSKAGIIAVLLIVFSYNGLSYLGYASKLTILYDYYELTMRLSAGLLVFLTYFYGIKDGIININNSRADNNHNRGYWLFCRSLK